MHRHIIVQRGVYGARAQPVRHRPETEHPESVRQRKPEQRRGREGHAYRRHHARPQFFGQPVGQETGTDRAARNDHGDNARPRRRNAEIGLHRRPRGTEEGIGKPQADKREINDCQ